MAAALCGLVFSCSSSPSGSTGPVTRIDTDVVIVGGGGAGLVAAIQASKLGARVVVLEKTDALGGNTNIAGGNYAAVDPVRQRASGISDQDSIDLHIRDVLSIGQYQANPALVDILCRNALPGLEFLESVGVEFEPTVYLVIGSSIPRSHHNKESSGGYMIAQLKKYIEADSNITVYTNTPAVSLIQENGRVSGVQAQGKDGKTYAVRGSRGVILATGGYYGNKELIMKYNSNVHRENPPYGVLDDTGDGLLMAEALGARLVNMNLVQMMGLSSYALPPQHKGGTGNIIVINQNGERFVAEDAPHDFQTYEEIYKQPGDYIYTVFDQKTVTASGNSAALDAEIAGGRWFRANTIQELAARVNAPPEALSAAVNDFNSAVSAGRDRFGRTNFSGGRIDTPPYYISGKIYPQLRYSLGGLDVNAKTQVLDLQGQVIPGLYAAGEVVGAIHGAYRMSSHAIAMVTVFGRLAAQSVMGQ
jgi:fumarate reductase flavoprotein subunit